MKHTFSQYQCGLCLEHFSGATPYGLHFHPETGACLTCDELRAAGMRLNDAGFWAVTPRPIDLSTST
jgi:hypothetical protein